MLNPEVDQLAKILWDYHHLNQTVDKSDCIFVLCSIDLSVADRAVDLYFANLAPWMIFSGGVAHESDLLATGWDKPEAEVFADIALMRGIPSNKIIIEDEATNTGENVRFTKKILEEKGLNFQSFILVQKPYMERRTFATFKKVWPGKRAVVTSPQISFDKYCAAQNKDKIINIMVGDLQRIKIYSQKGYQIPQAIPDEVWQAYNKLVEMGFNKHLLKE